MDAFAEIVATLVPILLGALFLLAAALKLRNQRSFTINLFRYQWLPKALVRPLGWAVPFAEVVLGVVLVAGIGRFYSLIVAAAALAVFSTAIGIQLLRDNPADCGCFGRHLALLSRGRRVLVRNGILIGLDVVALVLLRVVA